MFEKLPQREIPSHSGFLLLFCYYCMAFVLSRRITISKAVANFHSFSWYAKIFSSRAAAFLGGARENSGISGIHLSSSLFMDDDKAGSGNWKIGVMDDETWRVRMALKDAWRTNEKVEAFETRPSFGDLENDGGIGIVNSVNMSTNEHDFDDIEDLRIRRNLFYKLDKDSKEYEEYKFDFHRRKSSKKKDRNKSTESKKKEGSSPKSILGIEDTSKKDTPRKMKNNKDDNKTVGSSRLGKKELVVDRFHQSQDQSVVKKQRVPTFNQLTAQYHEPFCLDIYISKGSVSASIIHRATSNVVAVSHSISKDMKFDLGSTKSRSACAAVGEVLARRALADDIHNVVYTPKKGEYLEGKLQIVLKSIMDGGIDVKVKLKQNKSRKGKIFGLRTRD